MAEAPPGMKERLATLHNRFVERSRQQSDRLAHLRDEIAHEGLSPARIIEVGSLAHSLHGNGGSFGHPEISAAGDVLEELCDTLTKGTQPADHSAADKLSAAAGALIDLVARLEP